MDIEKIIADIEWLEQLFRLPDNRPPQIADRKVESPKDNEIYINPLLRLLWQDRV